MANINLIKSKLIKIVKKISKVMHSNEAIVYQKNDASNLLTDKDIIIQKSLISYLSKLIPNSNFYSEEKEGKIDNKNDYTWIIDPIDGTTNFSRHIPFTVISVALKYKNDIVLGVVYNPFTKEMFSAIKGNGAYLNNKKISTSKKTLAQSLFCTSLCVYKKENSDISYKIISEIYKQISDIRRFGSCALELCYLACGRCDLYFEMNVCPWDFAGAYIVLLEAGGTITTLNGQTPNFDKPISVIAANNKSLHKMLIAIVDKNLKGE